MVGILFCIIMVVPIKGDVDSLMYSSLTIKESIHSIVNFSGTTPFDSYITLPSTKKVNSIESDAKEKTIYFHAVSDRTLYQIQNITAVMNDTYRIKLFKRGISSGLTKLAYDRSSRNLYWTDSGYNWIAMKPVYANDKSIYRIIIRDNIKRPEGLAVDTVAGYIFWSSLVENVRIERANLDGKSRVILVHTALSRVISMTSDTKARILYWVDTVRQTVESCDYNGRNRRIVIRLNGRSLADIDIKQNTLYVSSLNTNKILAIDKVSGVVKKQIGAKSPYALEIFGGSEENTTSTCLSRKCSHMCINTPGRPQCLCKEGYKLMTDGRSCISNTKMFNDGILFTNGSSICMIHVESISGNTIPYICTKIPGLSLGALAVGKDRLIAYDKASNSLIAILFTDLTLHVTLLSTVDSVKKIFYNWKDDRIIWIDEFSSSIKAFRQGDFTPSSTLYSGLVQPNYLAADPFLGYIYWIEGGVMSKSIKKGKMYPDNRPPESIVNTGILKSPTGLAFDYGSRRLYYIDNGILMSVAENGSNIASHGPVSSGKELAIFQNYAVVSDSTSKLYIKLIHSKSLSTLSLDTTSKEIIAYNPSIMTTSPGACDIMNGGCDHICLPSKSGRECRCEHGFALEVDGKCKSNPLQNNFAIVTDYTHDKIYQVSMDGKTVTALDIPNISNTPCAVFDPFDRKVYIADVSSRQIKSVTLSGTNLSVIYTPGFAHPDRLAIDFTTGSLYYTAVSKVPSQSYIGVVNVKTLAHKRIVTQLESPRAIALYPSKGFIFWSDHGNSSHIGRAYMDGSSKSVIASNEIKWPNGLAIDYSAERIYWTDGYYDKIESCDVSGANRRMLMQDKYAHMMDIVIKGAYIYYTAWRRQKVMKVAKSTGILVSWMDDNPEFGRIDSLDFYPADVQPDNGICKTRNGGCSTFCFPTPSGRSCGCPDNIQLNSDGRSCSGDTLCSSTIRNGQLSSYCLRYVGEICNFTCNIGYEPSSSKAVIKCGQLGHWSKDTDTVCKVKTCNESFTNGKLLDSCIPSIGAQCGYECLHGFSKNSDVSYLTCLSSGNWDRNPSSLCLANVKTCTRTLRNGKLLDTCIPSIGAQCGYECQQGFSKTSDVLYLTCLSSGSWDRDPSSLCLANAKRCDKTLPNGKLLDPCTPSVGVHCGYECQSGFSKRSNVSFLTCLSSGSWNRDPSSLCLENGKIMCNKTFSNGKLTDSCIPSNGVQCGFECAKGFSKRNNVSFLTCLSSGNWDQDPSSLCSTGVSSHSSNITLSISGGVAGILLLLGIVCGIVSCYRRSNNRRREIDRARYESSGNINIECIINPMEHTYEEIRNLIK